MKASSTQSLSALVIFCSILQQTSTAFAPTSLSLSWTTSTRLQATSGEKDLFKAGLLANCEETAADLASSKIRSVQDLGWKQPTARRPSSIRPKYWAWGGADELPLQDKPNYDASSENCPEKWLTLSDFYTIVKDDTAVADTIFVALAGGRAFVERNVAENVLEQWYSGGSGKSKRFNRDAFFKTVKRGQQDFLLGWGSFLGITGFAVVGIVFPTNPLQLALVNGLEVLTGNVK
jgi:hypothetical protein